MNNIEEYKAYLPDLHKFYEYFKKETVESIVNDLDFKKLLTINYYKKDKFEELKNKGFITTTKIRVKEDEEVTFTTNDTGEEWELVTTVKCTKTYGIYTLRCYDSLIRDLTAKCLNIDYPQLNIFNKLVTPITKKDNTFYIYVDTDNTSINAPCLYVSFDCLKESSLDRAIEYTTNYLIQYAEKYPDEIIRLEKFKNANRLEELKEIWRNFAIK